MASRAGDVVVVDFIGATGIKRRPAVVLSTDRYHVTRPDVILGLLTSNIAAATTEFDHILSDWQTAGLRSPSAFRTYIMMATPRMIRPIGRLTDRDWNVVRVCLERAIQVA